MNSITRLILHRLASGEVSLTWEIIEALKEANADRSAGAKPEKSGREPSSAPEEPDLERSDTDSRLTFVNPLPGRWIRRTGCALGSALLLAAGLFQATAGPDIFETANRAFALGNYTEAEQGFESVIAQRGYSAPVLFNLANAQQKAGQLGRAILNYERAALLSPNDSDIAANLHQAQELAGVEAMRHSRIQQAAHWLSLHGWGCLSVSTALLIAVALPLKRFRPQTQFALNLGSVAAGLALAVSITAIAWRSPELDRAVVTAPEAVAGISPVAKAQPLFKLRAGEVVTWQRAHGGFALVRNQSNQEGWVKAGEVERIIPLPAKTTRS